MSDPSLFIKALGIGVAVAAPVGPMSLLCMRTTLTRGWRHGLAVGGGIAIGDALYGAVAALGLAGLSAFMLAHQKPLHIAAGLFLIYLGLKSFWPKNAAADPDVKTVSVRGWGWHLATSILLTLTNPPTIIMFAAVFTALAPTDGFDASSAFATIAGVFLGSLLWWCILVSLIGGLRHAIGPRARVWIDRVSGIVLAALGAAELRRGIAT
jgi:threonine/homoserine/homoserine lactone efflux protein